MPPKIEHKMINGKEYKICRGECCNKSETWKKLEEFGKDKKTWDKLKTECKVCKNFRERIRLSKNKEESEKSEDSEESNTSKKRMLNTNETIFKLLDNYELCMMEDIEETDEPSKSDVLYECLYGHENTTRLDTIKQNIKEYEKEKRYAVCNDCNKERTELKKLMENEHIVEEKGYALKKIHKNERGDILYDILCKNNHLTIDRTKTSFIRSFNCKECNHNADEYICTGCNNLLTLDSFSKYEKNTHRNKTDHYCKKCRSEQVNKRKENGYKYPSKEKIIINEKEGKICVSNECGFHEYSKYYSGNSNADGYDNHCKKCKDIFNFNYRENNKEKIKNIQREYVKNNKEKIKEYTKNHRDDNREKYRKTWRTYVKNRRDNDIKFKLLMNMRHRIYLALKGNSKSDHTLNLIGCTVEELWIHLENKFDDKMTRENYGEWHIDHIKPCSLFNFDNELEQRKCFNYRNLQPMHRIENIFKNNKYDYDESHENLLDSINKN